MDQATTVVGLWEWDAAARRDCMDAQLAEFLLANGLCVGSPADSLLMQLEEPARQRLWDAAERACASRVSFSEVVELGGAGRSSKRLQLQGGCLPSRDHCLVAICCVASQSGAGKLLEPENHRLIDLDLKQRALEQSINGIVIGDMEARLTFVNDAFLRSLGYSNAAEVLGRHGLEFCFDQTLGVQVIETLLAGGSWIGEITLLRKDGQPIEMLLSATLLRDPAGEPQCLMASHIDITVWKQQEQALRASKASLKLSRSYLQAIFDSSPECIKVVDQDCRLIDMNQAGIRALELDSLDQIRGKDIREWIAPEDRETFRRAVQAACAGERTAAQFQVLTSTGSRRWMEQHAVGMVGPEGTAPQQRMVSVTRDITERLQIQAKLQESERHYRQLFETMTEGFALHELIVNERGEPVDFRYLDVNPAFETLLSLRRDEVVGRRHSEFPSADREFWVKTYGQVALSGEPLRMEYVHPQSKREWIVLAYRTQPLRFAVLFSEISKWRQAEQERRIMHERLLMIINNAPLILFSLDRAGRVTASEGKGLARVGLKPGQLVGKKISEEYPNATAEISAIGRALAGESVSFQAEGPGVCFDSHYEPLFDADGQVIGMTGLAIDLTEQAKTQVALRESEARLQLLLKNAPAGVAMLDRDLKYIAYSQRWLVDYRLEGQELLGRSHYELFPEIPERWKEIHRRCLRGAVESCERDRFERCRWQGDLAALGDSALAGCRGQHRGAGVLHRRYLQGSASRGGGPVVTQSGDPRWTDCDDGRNGRRHCPRA